MNFAEPHDVIEVLGLLVDVDADVLNQSWPTANRCIGTQVVVDALGRRRQLVGETRGAPVLK